MQQNEFEKKDLIIQKIKEGHPGSRPDRFKHYGYYTGGMKDTGGWYYEVMIKDNLENLQTCLDLLTPTIFRPVKSPEPSAANKTTFSINGKEYWIDWDEFQAQQDFFKKKEERYWEWHFSGQRTINMFGVEGAKRVLERQHKNDMKRIFEPKSRGRETI